ncbi:protein yippee-like 1 isoform X2 [Platichthys flesus]|uniref:protein yippee-like 1 isoform X2 n=1 Tax=Platichthys flesus TaxID=8260 RepID=UPI002DB6A475|nr:protein yippee-like 1 isoform X2 [Platichthys flesus]
MVKMTKSKTFQAYLPSCHRTYSCIHCRAHLANHDELISKSFQGSQGRAYLFNSVIQIFLIRIRRRRISRERELRRAALSPLVPPPFLFLSMPQAQCMMVSDHRLHTTSHDAL